MLRKKRIVLLCSLAGNSLTGPPGARRVTNDRNDRDALTEFFCESIESDMEAIANKRFKTKSDSEDRCSRALRGRETFVSGASTRCTTGSTRPEEDGTTLNVDSHPLLRAIRRQSILA